MIKTGYLDVRTLAWLMLLVPLASGQTIDQLISKASETSDDFAVMADLHGNFIRHDLDMILTEEQYGALMGYGSGRSSSLHRHKRKAIRNEKFRWPNGVIPYVLDHRAGFTQKDRQEIDAAFRMWTEHTCLSFRKKTWRDKNFVSFEDKGGCFSYVGMTGAEGQTLSLARGCRFKGIIAHEVGHVIGFQHEQNRPDRDNHVVIMERNIPPGVIYNFKKYPSSYINTYNVPYDYKSIMHYGSTAFSMNKQYTIRTRDPAAQKVIGNRKELSFNDVKLANLMYGCGKSCSSRIPCPSPGFLDKNCRCWCPGNPMKLCNEGPAVVKPTRSPTTYRPRVTTATPRGGECRDFNRHCPKWAHSPTFRQYNYCTTNYQARVQCKLSCNRCTTKPKCEDAYPSRNCKHWASGGHCGGDFMKKNCAKTCDVCTNNVTRRPGGGRTGPVTRRPGGRGIGPVTRRPNGRRTGHVTKHPYGRTTSPTSVPEGSGYSGLLGENSATITFTPIWMVALCICLANFLVLSQDIS